MDLSINLVRHTKNTYTYKIHTSPSDYCKKLMAAGSKNGKVIKKGSDIELNRFIPFYSFSELRSINPLCIESCIIYHKGKQVLFDWSDNTFTVQNVDENFVSELLTIFYTTDTNMEEVWNNLVEIKQGVS